MKNSYKYFIIHDNLAHTVVSVYLFGLDQLLKSADFQVIIRRKNYYYYYIRGLRPPYPQQR